MFDKFLVFHAFERLKKSQELSRITPKTWGGPLEELYETIIAKMNAAVDIGWGKDDPALIQKAIELERHYINLRNALEAAHPELQAWYGAQSFEN